MQCIHTWTTRVHPTCPLHFKYPDYLFVLISAAMKGKIFPIKKKIMLKSGMNIVLLPVQELSNISLCRE